MSPKAANAKVCVPISAPMTSAVSMMAFNLLLMVFTFCRGRIVFSKAALTAARRRASASCQTNEFGPACEGEPDPAT
jgi:hypothetical protein